MNAGRTLQRILTGSHVWLLRTSGGRVGGKVGRVEHVVLVTTGRRSGRPRATPLAATFDEGRVLLVASNGGSDRAPDWYLNLCAHPEVAVEHAGRRRAMRARTADDEERERLWPRVLRTWPGYDGYQRRTARRIPVVICEPLADPGGADPAVDPPGGA